MWPRVIAEIQGRSLGAGLGGGQSWILVFETVGWASLRREVCPGMELAFADHGFHILSGPQLCRDRAGVLCTPL